MVIPSFNLKLAHIQKSLDWEMMNGSTACVPSDKISIHRNTVSKKKKKALEAQLLGSSGRSCASVIQDDFLESSGSAADEVRLRQGAQMGNWCLVAAGGKDVGGHRPREGILYGLSPQL